MITSTANPKIKALARLAQRRERDAAGMFPIEGARLVQRALDAGWPLAEALVAPGLAAESDAIRSRLAAAGVPVVELGDEAFRKVAYRRHPDGVLAVGRTRDLRIDALQPGADPLVLVVEAIEKPGNLGAMLRTADGAGIDAVIVADAATDPFNPNVVRASQGALFTVPLAVASPSVAIAWLETREVGIVAAAPEGGVPPWRHDLTGSTAIVIGSEHAGLSPAWASFPRVTLPMAGAADSLNAAATAAVLCYEARRQRS